ncbi:MAG: hypothetical protein WC107_06250 [Patescibacteria group bacterium]
MISDIHSVLVGETWRDARMIARADCTPITAGTVNYFLKAMSGANAGKWWKNADQTWDASETANAMTHVADGGWMIELAASPFVEGVVYAEYMKESGNLHIPGHFRMVRGKAAAATDWQRLARQLYGAPNVWFISPDGSDSNDGLTQWTPKPALSVLGKYNAPTFTAGLAGYGEAIIAAAGRYCFGDYRSVSPPYSLLTTLGGRAVFQSNKVIPADFSYAHSITAGCRVRGITFEGNQPADGAVLANGVFCDKWGRSITWANKTTTLTTRTDEHSGVFTAGVAVTPQVGEYLYAHWLDATETYDFYRYEMRITAIDGMAITLSGGFGDPLPAEGSTVYLTYQRLSCHDAVLEKCSTVNIPYAAVVLDSWDGTLGLSRNPQVTIKNCDLRARYYGIYAYHSVGMSQMLGGSIKIDGPVLDDGAAKVYAAVSATGGGLTNLLLKDVAVDVDGGGSAGKACLVLAAYDTGLELDNVTAKIHGAAAHHRFMTTDASVDLAVRAAKFNHDRSLTDSGAGTVTFSPGSDNLTIADGDFDANAVADALLDRADGVESGKTLRQALRIMGAGVAGILSGAGTPSQTFLGLDGVTPRIQGTTDIDGNRTAITYP